MWLDVKETCVGVKDDKGSCCVGKDHTGSTTIMTDDVNGINRVCIG